MSTELNERLQVYLEAEKAILVGGQNYKIGNRLLTRADLAAVQTEILRLKALGATTDTSSTGIVANKYSRRTILRDD